MGHSIKIAAASAATLLCLCAPAHSRPYTVEDLLQTEGLGRVDFDPNGRWAVLEHRRPYATAPRYDYNQQTGMLLTQLLKIDLRRPGAKAEPLFAQDSESGVLAGPISPDGRRMLVYRLRDHSYELGVASLDAPQVRWLPLTPELANHGAVAAWRNRVELVVIVRARGDLPRQLALGWEAQERLQQQWRRTRLGREPAVTAIGSGRFLGVRPRAAPARLIRLDVRTGAVTALATGEFQDLALSPSGRWAAVIGNGEDLQPTSAEPIYTAFPARRRHLRLVDLETGRVTAPCSQCDVAFGLLSWSADSSRLIVGGRAEGPGGDGKALIEIDAALGTSRRPLPATLTLDLQATRNEQAPRARAVWMGDDLLVYARDLEGRADWYRLADGAATRLTGGLASVPRQLASVGPTTIQLVADGALWTIDREGRANHRPLADGTLIVAPPQPAGARFAANPVPPHGGVVLQQGQTLRRLGSDRQQTAPIDPACGAPSLGPSSVIMTCTDRGGRRVVRLIGWSGVTREILEINAALQDVEGALVRPVDNGAGSHSWLYLPRTPAPTGGFPLVVVPYRGSVYPRPDPRFDVGAFTSYLNPQLLAAAGYAVLTPSLPYDEARGEPALGMAEDIIRVVDAALAAYPLDGERIALWGHSFGAMNAVSAAGQSRRFKSVIAVSGMHDITSRWGMIPTHRWVVPEDNASVGPSGTVEGAQARMGAPPWIDPDRYVRNSNIFASGHIAAPVLLIHGETDELRPEQSQEMFTALYRQGKDAQLVTYWGEGHALASPGNIRDYYARVIAWLGATLPAESPAPPPEVLAAAMRPLQ